MPIDDIIEQTTNVSELRQQREATNGAPAHPTGEQPQQRVVADGGQQMPPQPLLSSLVPQTHQGWMLALQGVNALLLAILVFVK